MNAKLKVGIIGVGMVGEPIRRWFEERQGYRRGVELFCYDINPQKGCADDPNKADVIFVAVPTPANPDGSCNLSALEHALASIKDGKIVVIKSTIAPGTTERLQKKYPKKRLLFNPEFLTESQAWFDFVRPDRQIIAASPQSQSDAREILAILPQAHFARPWSSDYSKKTTTPTEAEVAKYASNVFGYLKVIYANILADVSHALELQLKKENIETEVAYESVREIIGADPRIGPAWLDVERGDYAGVGGWCFPKDMEAFIKTGEDLKKNLAKDKKVSPGLIKNLAAGMAALKAVCEYNKTLLEWQGLKPSDLNKHVDDIIVKKRKRIRAGNNQKI